MTYPKGKQKCRCGQPECVYTVLSNSWDTEDAVGDRFAVGQFVRHDGNSMTGYIGGFLGGDRPIVHLQKKWASQGDSRYCGGEGYVATQEWTVIGPSISDEEAAIASIITGSPRPDVEVEPRQIVIVHERLWNELSAFAFRRGMDLVEIPSDGDTPTYIFSPR